MCVCDFIYIYIYVCVCVCVDVDVCARLCKYEKNIQMYLFTDYDITTSHVLVLCKTISRQS